MSRICDLCTKLAVWWTNGASRCEDHRPEPQFENGYNGATI